MVHCFGAVFLFTFIAAAHANTYNMTEHIVGADFLDAFMHEAIPDPTHGRVNYVSRQEALDLNLTFASNKTFIMRADHTTTLNPAGPGRNSNRIVSNKQYTTHVIVAKIRHMPDGCSTWPAFWEVGADWPNNGEVDIIEGVNGMEPSASSLHTSAGCTMPTNNTLQSGLVTGTDCNAFDNGNAGCGVQCNKANNFASGFNNNGGGWYAMERTNMSIKIWFWARNDETVPCQIKNGTTTIDTSKWGLPFANFPNTSCDIDSHFGPHNVVFDSTFCGDWAGAVFTSQGCGSDCVSFVNDNPQAFTEAYWDIASLTIYQ